MHVLQDVERDVLKDMYLLQKWSVMLSNTHVL